MDDQVNFDFGFDFTNSSSDGDGLQQQWALYRSTAASSSGADLSTYDYGGATYSSSEGGYSSIHDTDHWNSSFDVPSYSTDIDIDDNDQDMVLPMPRISTSSPPSSSPPPAQPQFVDTGAYNLKRPRAPVAADLDTANILLSEHRHKRMKPARVTHTA